MQFKDLVAISGKSGLYEMVKTRPDGLIVRSLGDNSKGFVSSRKHSFTPLDNIGVYMQNGDTIELHEVMEKIAAQGGNRAMASDTPKEMRDFFRLVLPEHDEEKVRVSDMKKILQWYEELMLNDFFENEDEEE